MISRRSTLKLLGATGATIAMGFPAMAKSKDSFGNSKQVSRILFGSCAHQDKEQPVWGPVNALDPDLFIFLGDNIYGDTRDMNVLADKYKKLGDKSGFQNLRANTPIIATWDDHDFGENDAGVEYPQKESSREQFLDFWQEPRDSPRRQLEDGIYTSYMYGPAHERVQVILLDLRWNRTSITRVSEEIAVRRDQLGFGPYIPNEGEGATMLGEKQWAWLERELKEPARVRLIGSSVQFLSEFPGWEGWSLFPKERQRMIDLITKTRAEGVLFISGDTHWAEISRQKANVPYPLYDFTSSGLTQTWHNLSPNTHRLPGCLHTEVNFGIIEIDWNVPDPHIVLRASNVEGDAVFEKSLLLSQLSFSLYGAFD